MRVANMFEKNNSLIFDFECDRAMHWLQMLKVGPSVACNADELSRTKHCKVRLLIRVTFRVLDLPRSTQIRVVKFDWLHRYSIQRKISLDNHSRCISG